MVSKNCIWYIFLLKQGMNFCQKSWLKGVCILLLSLLASAAFAQTITVKGVVTDAAYNDPVIGATVMLVGDASKGGLTNLDGAYTLTGVPSNGTLRVSFVGYKTVEVPINGQTTINIILQEDNELLDEVVVTALGIKRSEKALAYNVQALEGDQLTAIKDANFINSLSGKVAGVNINKSASGVGGGTRVVIRGNKSIEGTNNALYVIDGIPISNLSTTGGDGSGFGGSSAREGISSINPEDIESISVLTGPSAAALYGASAANGVILINTKKGKEGALRVNFTTSYDAAKAYILPRFQNRYGNQPGAYTSWGAKLDQPTGYEPADFFNTGSTFNNSLSLTTGTDKNQTFVSLAAVNSTGIVPNNKYHRYNATFRNTSKMLNDKLTIDASASYVREFFQNMVSYGTYFNPIVGAYLYPRGEDFNREKYFERHNPETGLYQQYWSPGDFGMNIQNPYWIAYRNLRPEVLDRYTFFANANYAFTDYLNLGARFRLDNTHKTSQDKRFATTLNTYAGPSGRFAQREATHRQKYMDVMLNFDKQMSDDIRWNFNVGGSYEEYDYKESGYGGDLLLIPNKFTYDNVDPSKATPFMGGGNSRTANIAGFVSTEIGWRSALYLTLTGRADRPSQLINSQEPVIFYPSVGLSALVTELLPEHTKSAIRPYLSYFKIRGSYTEVGSPIPFTGLTPGSATRKIVGGVVQPFEYYPVSDLKAERTRSYELGIDARMFNNLVNLGVTLYQSNTYNQLLRAELGQGSGYDYMFAQAGNVRNRGIEISLGIEKEFGDFFTGTTLTATANRNKIIQLASKVKNPITGEDIDLSVITKGRFRLVEGGEIGMMYATEKLKEDADGYIVYNKEGDRLITEATKPYELGSVNPDWLFGLNQTLSYKGLRLDLQFNARVGGVVISGTQAMLDRYGVSEESALARDNGMVMMSEKLAVNPRDYYTSVSVLDSYYTYSATNIRLQEARLSYTLKTAKWTADVLKDATLSLYGTNLWMIYNKAPFDPELTAGTGTFGQGYDYFLMPSQRTLGFSLKLGF